MSKFLNPKVIIGIVLVTTIIILATQFGQYLTLENAKVQQAALRDYIDQNFITAAAIYFFAYVGHHGILSTGCSRRYSSWRRSIRFLDQFSLSLFR
ncbi:uncharacterized membrane protein [Vibrio astriarenae]|nr:uncharacterized membrane protein [Vibrio sp. C7]